ncbi:uncharacterized protein E0L32_007853 [Thyridium curvatum]|uniref:Uncharacterized protein n=1 Tax=Thyridium curvatum TaxID=1093900 RepID=A0A507AYA2_9PEZI|nr:uncharacterized protein E0L32_007853 [Thyridium curvatum]TPX11434.1 hypothetical protein E0L32_007853 [Thyridium curvatum]
MAPVGGIWAPIALRALRRAIGDTAKMTKVLRNKLANATRVANAEVQPVTVRAGPRQPVHPVAFLRQSKRSGGTRYHSTWTNINATLRRFASTASEAAPRFDRTAYLKSATASRAVWQSTGRAPFASTLRPNLTGGALPRTAGGYSLGAGGRTGARYFSHTPAAPAQVVQNVSQAMRAFWLSGQRARFDGYSPNGERRFRAVSALEDEAGRKLAAALPLKDCAGAWIDFSVNPTITALTPLAAFANNYTHNKSEMNAATLGAEGFLDVLSVDFARALKELSAVMNDLKRLASLGDLPILLEKGSTLRVRFPGVDADTVERLCDDLGVTRGVVGEDDDFNVAMGVPLALQFPFAPDVEGAALSSPGGSMRSHRSELSSISEDAFDEFMEENPWLVEDAASLSSGEEGYASMSPPHPSSGEHCSDEFEGLEGIYRFLEECDRAKQRQF